MIHNLQNSANRGVCLALMLLLAVSIAPGQRMELIELREVVGRLVRLNVPDAQAAARIRRLQPTQQVPDDLVAEAKSWGAGPLALRELQNLAAKSTSRPANLHPLPSVQGRPGEFLIQDGEPAMILETIRLYAEDYSQSIPNFLCYRNTTFSRDKTGAGRWEPHLTLRERLVHLEDGDHHEIVAVDGEDVDGDVRIFHGGITVTGEFGNIIKRIFQESTQAKFSWIGDFQEAGERRVAIAFQVALANTSIEMSFGRKKAKAGYRGELIASADTGRIYRLRLSLEDLEPGFAYRGASWDIHYAEVTVEGQDLLLPVRAITEAYESASFRRNEATYTDYQKYSADSVIEFGDIAGTATDSWDGEDSHEQQ